MVAEAVVTAELAAVPRPRTRLQSGWCSVSSCKFESLHSPHSYRSRSLCWGMSSPHYSGAKL